MRYRLLVVGLLAALGLVTPAPSGAAPAQDPTMAPATTLSDGGRTVRAGGTVLRASQVEGLDPAGQAVTVEGSGYDVQKGVYVSFCALPPAHHPPSPCAGGQDRSGTSGGSAWISSNPPDYATGLPTPYGPGGTFLVTVDVVPVIADGIDCRVVRCAIVTRNDHTRGTDRSQDLFLPVTFRAPGDPAPPPTQPPATLAPTTTTTAAPDPVAVAPATTLSEDGRTASDGTRSLTVSVTEGLDPAGAALTVTGAGFDGSQGIYVALCRVPEPGRAPGPCTAGAGRSGWVSSNPPDYGRDLAVPFEAGGRFELALEVSARIDDATDCRAVACALATRSDDTAPGDRRNDLLVPVSFADAAASTTAAPPDDQQAASARPDDEDDGGRGLPLVALGGAGLAGVGIVAALVVRSRRRGGPAGAAP